MEVGLITDKDFYKLQLLHYKLQCLLPQKLSRVQSSIMLLTEIQNTTSIHAGLFKDEELVGFVSGFSKDEDTFHVSNLYIEPRYRFGFKKLGTFMEDIITLKGYNSWDAYSRLPKGKNIIKKFGAKEI